MDIPPPLIPCYCPACTQARALNVLAPDRSNQVLWIMQVRQQNTWARSSSEKEGRSCHAPRAVSHLCVVFPLSPPIHSSNPLIKIQKGAPGSGKSTLARALAAEHAERGNNRVVICSTDTFSLTPDGRYRWRWVFIFFF